MTALGNPVSRSSHPLVGAAVGSGITAQAAESGGADFLMVLNAGHFRMQGCSSMAALMPYENANTLTWRMAEQHILPRVRKVPVFLGVCAQDPDLHLPSFLERVRGAGFSGITNFPSVGFIDGNYRAALEETGFGFGREVEVLKAAREAGLATIAFCFQPAEAAAMAGAGAEMLCLDLGFAEWREMREADHAQAMDGAIGRIRDMMRAAHATAAEKRFVVFGGPVGTPRDWAQILEHTGVDGYVGGSTIERFPTAGLIASTVREFKAVGQPVETEERLGALTGRGAAMRRVFETLSRAAETDAPVLILGESGTGKELAARELHRLSLRRNAPLVSWNCGALTESLAMSELFGHERGAFTGATFRHSGKFEQANGGTLFMDELTDLPLPIQASLLRVIQEREIVRVGGRENVPVDVRLVAATNRNLPELIRTGSFRLDLYYRISTMVVRIPPLRERPEDIPGLVEEIATDAGRRLGCPVPRWPRSVLSDLMRHSWPGNVRELRNAIERILIMGRGETVRPEWLEDFFRMASTLAEDGGHGVRPADGVGNRPPVGTRERLTETLRRHGGNKAATARELGITRKTLYEWLRKN